MNFLVLVPDGVGIRNFLCAPFIDFLSQRGNVIIWHGLPESAISEHTARYSDNVRWHALPPFPDTPIRRLSRQSRMYSRLYSQRHAETDQVLRNRQPSGTLSNRVFKGTAQLLGRMAASSTGMRCLDFCDQWILRRASNFASFRSFLESQQPSVVFCTHQRAMRAMPAMLAARDMGIPTATFIYSWDNLPKGEMAVSADHFLVWSNFMRDELMKFHPEVVADRVHVVGTPQFEHYFNEAMVLQREVFLPSLGLDPERPVVCFSGSAVPTSPHDPVYLGDVAEALRSFPSKQRPQLLFRRCPVDISNRYDSVLRKYPEIAVSEPAWTIDRNGEWTQIVPTMEDIGLLVNVVRHCDLVVNIGSTMAMDFAIVDKPGIYIYYDPPQKNGGPLIEEVYRLPHFRSVHELQPVYWARSPEHLGELVRRALSNPLEKSRERSLWLRREVMEPFHEASERFSNELSRLVIE
jgi:hypothetical protein